MCVCVCVRARARILTRYIPGHYYFKTINDYTTIRDYTATIRGALPSQNILLILVLCMNIVNMIIFPKSAKRSASYTHVSN